MARITDGQLFSVVKKQVSYQINIQILKLMPKNINIIFVCLN